MAGVWLGGVSAVMYWCCGKQEKAMAVFIWCDGSYPASYENGTAAAGNRSADKRHPYVRGISHRGELSGD